MGGNGRLNVETFENEPPLSSEKETQSLNGPSRTPTAHARSLFRYGLVASVLYAGTLGIYAWSVWASMRAMSPDEFATFLSGVFAPLAFLWLVLGFRQQGDELQNSANALWLQGEELRNSVEQQRALVEVSREQLSAEYTQRLKQEEDEDRAAQPQIIAPNGGGSFSGAARTLNIVVQSGGPTCTDVELVIDGDIRQRMPVFSEGNRFTVENQYSRPEDVEPVSVEVRYTDRRGNRKAQSFLVPIDEHGGPNGDRAYGIPARIPGVKSL